MKIIDNKKDYYDYLSGIFGIDEYITYDRRNSVKLCNDVNKNLTSRKFIFNEYPTSFAKFFCPWKNGRFDNRDSNRSDIMSSYNWDAESNAISSPDGLKYMNITDLKYVGILIGFELYIYRVYRCLKNEFDPNVKIIPVLVGKKAIDRKSVPSVAPIIIGHLTKSYRLSYSYIRDEKDEMEFVRKAAINFSEKSNYIENPIFAGTWVPSCISPEDVWNNVTDYLLSLKEKPIIDRRTDIEHLESAGFDKKSSFRNVK